LLGFSREIDHARSEGTKTDRITAAPTPPSRWFYQKEHEQGKAEIRSEHQNLA
jgi:hypothetical protein